MTTQTSTLVQDQPLTEEQVSAYLRAHPDFFEHKEALLEQMRLPHHVSGAVSLVERQIRVLRGKNQALEQKLVALVKAANASETLSSRLHELALALIAANTLDDVLATAQEKLVQAFKADHALVRMLSDAPAEAGIHYVERQNTLTLFATAYETHRPQCGTLNRNQIDALFGDAATGVGSAVLVPLAQTSAIGYLALGSRDPHRFNAGMGTLFLGYLGDLVSQAIVSHLDRKRESSIAHTD